MKDSEKTKLLTKIGFLLLKNMGCYAISTEINIHTWLDKPEKNSTDELKHWHEKCEKSNNHHIIDVLGIAKEYIPHNQQQITEHGKIRSHDILRGIEIKVSHSDLKNGFMHTGCHYNYLMIPKNLVKLEEVHKDIGVIEVDLKSPIIKTTKWFSNTTFNLPCICFIRKPKRQKKINQSIIDLSYNSMLRALTSQTKRWLVSELSIKEVNL